MLAILLQLAVPLGQGLAASAFADGKDGYPNALFVCTAMGGIVQMPYGNGEEPNPDQSRPFSFCLLCQVRALQQSTLTVTQITPPLPLVRASPPGDDK